MGSIDTEWIKNRNKLEGSHGVQVLPNDGKDLMSRIIKHVKNIDGLPKDMDCPETETEVEAVDAYAQGIIDFADELAGIGEDMMVGDRVQREYEDIMDESGEAMSDHDKMVEAGHSLGDF